MQGIKGLAASAATAMLVMGCAVSPERITHSSDLDVCQSWGIYRASPIWAAAADSYEAEVRRRNLVRDKDWWLIQTKTIEVGMSRCALYAAFGKPSRENSTTTAGGERVQHVFDAGYTYIKAYYIYTERGQVVAWQK